MPVNRAKVPGRARDDVENIIGITPELFTWLEKQVNEYKDEALDFDDRDNCTFNNRKESLL